MGSVAISSVSAVERGSQRHAHIFGHISPPFAFQNKLRLGYMTEQTVLHVFIGQEPTTGTKSWLKSRLNSEADSEDGGRVAARGV